MTVEDEYGDLAWAKPFVDEAIGEVERGDVIALEDHDERIDALLSALACLTPETQALMHRLAAVQHLAVAETIRMAIEDKARAVGIPVEPRRPRDQSPEAIAARRARTDHLVAELATMPVLDPRSPRDIMDDLNAL